MSSISDGDDSINVYLDTGEYSLTGMICKVDKSEAASVIPFTDGDSISVQGVVKGKDWFNIRVEDCSVQDGT